MLKRSLLVTNKKKKRKEIRRKGVNVCNKTKRFIPDSQRSDGAVEDGDMLPLLLTLLKCNFTGVRHKFSFAITYTIPQDSNDSLCV